MELMFKEGDEKMDVQKMLSRSIISNKELQKCSISVMELVQKLAELFPPYMHQYSDYIISKCCIPIIKDSRSMARFKEICVKTIHVIVKQPLSEDFKMDQLISDVTLTLNQQVKSGCKIFLNITFEYLIYFF